MKDKKIENTLDDFLDVEKKEDKKKKIKKDKSLIERVDKIILVEDGRRLLND